MKLRRFCFYLILMVTLFISYDVYALSGKVNGTGVRIRSGAGTSYSTVAEDAVDGHTYTLLDSKLFSTSDGSTGCSTGKWYKLSYNNQVEIGRAHV